MKSHQAIMKMTKVRRAGWLLSLAGMACFGTAQAATISIVADEWCPYNCEPGSDKPGFMIEIAEKTLGAAGHTIDYKNMPWSRAIDEARKGKFDAIVGAAKDDAPDFTYPAEPLGLSGSIFVVRKGEAWRYAGLDSLAGHAIGVIQDYSYDDELDQYIEANAKDSAKVQVAAGETALETNIKKLEAKRIDALVEDQSVLNYALAQAGKSGAFDLAGKLSDAEIYIAFSPAKKESAEYAKILSEGLAKLRASGELKQILAKYGLEDWKK
ncbi:substrate-binding periplasmic protein [Pseudomarimonas arenosa]|uniref:Transporter substrate-binding domain-containing protein n=1 Tax=Pseudomarimonas arenosa TaxID=2774145 RepID=A0AAW3ZUR5_9GAMM|nr:transporter substrate-binding domain-containing protein [Pseudomarimonas arenosa]MBD8527786.1 transporter substrate-binding domain-containing protein [Pseudomarimonas arenosa]